MLKTIRKAHLYLGTVFAPLMIFLAFSGALQTFELHDPPKDSFFKPHAWIMTLAQVHKNQRTEGPPSKRHSVTLRWFFVIASTGLMITSVLGIYMAFKYSKRHALVYLSLALGIGLPILFLYL
jgi:hypothetical protein